MARLVLGFFVVYAVSFVCLPVVEKYGRRHAAFWLALTLILLVAFVNSLEVADYVTRDTTVDYVMAALLGAMLSLITAVMGLGTRPFLRLLHRKISLVAPE